MSKQTGFYNKILVTSAIFYMTVRADAKKQRDVRV